MTTKPQHPDCDIQKGTVEDDSPHTREDRPAHTNSLSGQLGHRDPDEELKDNDSDFPEPGSSPEHSGQHR